MKIQQNALDEEALVVAVGRNTVSYSINSPPKIVVRNKPMFSIKVMFSKIYFMLRRHQVFLIIC